MNLVLKLTGCIFMLEHSYLCVGTVLCLAWLPWLACVKLSVCSSG